MRCTSPCSSVCHSPIMPCNADVNRFLPLSSFYCDFVHYFSHSTCIRLDAGSESTPDPAHMFTLLLTWVWPLLFVVVRIRRDVLRSLNKLRRRKLQILLQWLARYNCVMQNRPGTQTLLLRTMIRINEGWMEWYSECNKAMKPKR